MMPSTEKAFILANLDEAIRLVREQAPSLFNLSAFVQKNECGTLYCTAGLLATSAHFRDLGWELRAQHGCMCVLLNGSACLYHPHLRKQFGPDAANLFFTRQRGEPYPQDDQALALWRLRRQRAIVEQL